MIKALDIKNELKEIYQKVKGKNNDELTNLDQEQGIDYLFLFIEKLPEAEKEVMSFLSLLLEKPIDEVQEIPFNEMASIIIDVFKDPNFKAFFQLAVK
jgi:hypothetical protein